MHFGSFQNELSQHHHDNHLSVLPRQLVKGYDIFAIVGLVHYILFRERLRVMTAAYNEISAPCSKPCPTGICCNYIVNIENCAVLSECNYLVRAGVFKQLRELRILCFVAL